ncbi:hypothetical protein BDW62DRAFT_218679 [Aspergillus aurantiobrunneus]
MLTSEAQSKFRPRRRHQKSRNGCLECKRRRIKCNEMKPSCSRCILTLQDCIYASPATSDPESAVKGSARRNDRPLHLPTPSPHSGLSPSSSSSFEPLQLSPEPYMKPSHQFSFDTSESGLYHHYLQHTSRTLTDNRRDFHALQICMPTLALRSKTVYHSILALSAACMCSDMINSEHPADVSAVSDVLMTGYRHYNQASERLRELISRPNASNAEPLLAAPPLLVPFATSSQQINHWISSRSEDKPSQKLLTSTPRDVIILSRGISATIRALQSNTSAFAKRTPIPEEIDSMDNYTSIPATPTIPPSHNHPMFPIIKQTSEAAFSKLRERIDWAFFYTSPNDSLSASAGAFDVLSTLRSAVFPSSTYHPPLPPSMTETPSLPQVPPWLVSFTARPSTPSPPEHMTRPFLSFLVHAPQKYLDLVLPLLDKRLEGPSRHSSPAELSVEEALALDIYAHWSVLMFLVEEESWWVGKLPNITLSGMINRYGDGFVARLWPVNMTGRARGGEGHGEWWPSSMLRIEREIGRYR